MVEALSDILLSFGVEERYIRFLYAGLFSESGQTPIDLADRCGDQQILYDCL